MNKGIEKQVQLFLQDEDGEAIALRYLAIINSHAYLTRKESFHRRGGSHSTKTKKETWENLKTGPEQPRKRLRARLMD